MARKLLAVRSRTQGSNDMTCSQLCARARSLKRGLIVPAVLAAAVFVAVAAPARADVTLGVLIPSSGKGAAYGISQQNAIDMFMEKYSDLGAAGKLKLDIYDTRGENPEAINLTRKLIGSNVVAIVGPQFSAEAEVAFPLAVRGETPMVTPMAAKPGIATANQPWAFRYALTSANDYAPLVAAWSKRQAKPIKTVVILMDGKDAVSANDGKVVFPAVLKANGIDVLDTITFQTGDIDYSAQVTRAKALNPDGIVISGLYNEAGHVAVELRKQGMNQPIVAGVGINHPRFIELGGPAVEGTMAGFDFFVDDPKPAVAAWAAEFEKRFKVQPGNGAALIYDTLYLMRDCIISTGITGKDVAADRVKMRDCWANMKNREAPLMGVTSMEKGDAVRSPVVLEVKGGRFAVAK
jgi:branched-chain amino acid transport system substrate-binding protein